jgi:hypothetical protein
MVECENTCEPIVQESGAGAGVPIAAGAGAAGIGALIFGISNGTDTPTKHNVPFDGSAIEFAMIAPYLLLTAMVIKWKANRAKKNSLTIKQR